ncbi:PAS domain S-box protein [Draconibacterium halophilum]|uniref:PAS domain S-box protein n=1 Tax=Draconibacterium halophilum TaxID=2706887 RepID=A0A6C0R8D4_9BACT|nr:PAS domain S-box protein [Draconibacterium halophilum]QIA06419.1 PAS domain S-box protein [Draconibacterium halophilum]
MEGKPYNIEHRIIENGKVKWLREKADIKFDKNGKAISVIGLTQNITEKKNAENELKKGESIQR